jgi:hypothetical protein
MFCSCRFKIWKTSAERTERSSEAKGQQGSERERIMNRALFALFLLSFFCFLKLPVDNQTVSGVLFFVPLAFLLCKS